ncbi:hypothetical protein BC830DRAFT_1135990 [Chytriomyces sp. MP71]|nr:hypothetical protein BC830DRAFT_1135990 [Chytriomyces sp. MP71]
MTSYKFYNMRTMTNPPIEVYPLLGMMGVAFVFGAYVIYKELAYDPELRLGKRGYNPDNWETRLNREPSVQKPVKNYFYRHLTQ